MARLVVIAVPAKIFAPVQEPTKQHLGLAPVLDSGERFLLRGFLHRYVAWCARHRRFTHMQVTARLYREVRAS